MNLTDRLYESVQDIWNSYYDHPFVKGIGDGTLDIEKFRFYMIQDYLYLYDYAKVFALGVAKASDHQVMRMFASSVNNILNGEMSIHKKYMQRLGITEQMASEAEISLSNASYTNYMLSIAYGGGELDILAAILSCSWSYACIGQRLNAIPGASRHEFYGEWIEGYASADYHEMNTQILELVNTLGADISETQYQRIEEIFINCSRYEAMFWDMSFNMEL